MGEARGAADGAERAPLHGSGNCQPPSDAEEEEGESGGASSEHEEESADCAYLGAAAHERAAQAERAQRVHSHRPRMDASDAYEQECERALHEDSRRSIFYIKPAAELLPNAAAPRDWHEADYLESLRVEEEERRRLERAERAGNPPPRREHAKYGARTNNPEGDQPRPARP